MYHRFNSDKYLDTSISSEKFNEQINYLIENNIKILPLDNLIDILENENKISENLVFITIDDAYKSFYEFGFPILKKIRFHLVFLYQVNIFQKMTSQTM